MQRKILNHRDPKNKIKENYLKMADKTIIDFIILSVTFGCAFQLHCYESLASMKGWPVGSLLRKSEGSIVGIFATGTILISLGIAFYLYNWWSPFAVIILGLLFMLLTQAILKERIQIMALAGAVIGLVLCPAYIL